MAVTPGNGYGRGFVCCGCILAPLILICGPASLWLPWFYSYHEEGGQKCEFKWYIGHYWSRCTYTASGEDIYPPIEIRYKHYIDKNTTPYGLCYRLPMMRDGSEGSSAGMYYHIGQFCGKIFPTQAISFLAVLACTTMWMLVFVGGCCKPGRQCPPKCVCLLAIISLLCLVSSVAYFCSARENVQGFLNSGAWHSAPAAPPFLNTTNTQEWKTDFSVVAISGISEIFLLLVTLVLGVLSMSRSESASCGTCLVMPTLQSGMYLIEGNLHMQYFFLCLNEDGTAWGIDRLQENKVGEQPHVLNGQWTESTLSYEEGMPGLTQCKYELKTCRGNRLFGKNTFNQDADYRIKRFVPLAEGQKFADWPEEFKGCADEFGGRV